MRALRETVRAFILKLRRSEEPTKRKWVYLISGTFTLIILFLWVGYLNIMIPKIPEPPDAVAAETAPVSTSKSDSESFFSVLGRGFSAILNDIHSGMSSLGSLFSKTYDNAKQSFGGTQTDVNVESPNPEQAPERLFLDLNEMATSVPTSTINP